MITIYLFVDNVFHHFPFLFYAYNTKSKNFRLLANDEVKVTNNEKDNHSQVIESGIPNTVREGEEIIIPLFLQKKSEIHV